MSTRLSDHARNTYSQFGEDGIIEAALDFLANRDKWCVEFGAWDGIHLSNTRELIERQGYSAVMIEANRRRFHDLSEAHKGNAKIIPINAAVGFTEKDSLDVLLAGTAIPKDFDFLSIDIDGNDYHAWKAVTAYTPKLICIEYNPWIPTELEFVQPADPKTQQGSSLRSLVELGKEKGYELIAVTYCNAFFVRRAFFSLFGIVDNRPETLREDRSSVTYVFFGYDGTMFVRGRGLMGHHSNITVNARIRQLPSIFRKLPDFSPTRNFLYRLYCAISRRLGRA